MAQGKSDDQEDGVDNDDQYMFVRNFNVYANCQNGLLVRVSMI